VRKERGGVSMSTGLIVEAFIFARKSEGVTLMTL